MTQDARTVKVSKDLEDLIPTYLTNRNKELDVLRQALAGGDFEQMRQIGHRMRGVGVSYFRRAQRPGFIWSAYRFDAGAYRMCGGNFHLVR